VGEAGKATRMTNRPTWIRCIQSPETNRRLCDRVGDYPDWLFTGLDHAYLSAIHGSRLVACPECVRVAVIAMTVYQDSDAAPQHINS
jgi:hypothetical protein